jgi:cytochrome c-type biogenesis protein CcmH/NrfG
MANRTESRPLKARRKIRPRETRAVAPPSDRATDSTKAQVTPPLPQPAAEAVSVFQRGMEALQRHAYQDAARAFQCILMGHSGERALAERAKVYLALCDREANHRPVSPKTIEERLTAATAALNNGHDAEAEELARTVLGDDPKHDLALYLLAAIHARRGDNVEALTLLAKVLALSPEAAAQARADEDFADLHEMDDFRAMTERPAPASLRHGRRARSDR